MGKVIVTVQVTADGVIGNVDDWFEGGEQEEVGADQLLLADALLLGRKTYESLSSIWPRMGGDFADRLNGIPKYVASRTLQGPLTWNAELIKGDIADEVPVLRQRHRGDLLVYGCGEFAFSLANQGVADEVRLWVHPIVWGNGERLFHELGHVRLRLNSSTIFRTGVILQNYAPRASE